MIRSIIFLFPFLALLSTAEELKVVSDNFKGDQQKGVSVFTGHVKITKGFDEMNASKITIYTDKSNKPSKDLAEGDVSFYIVTEQNEKYRGTAQTAVYLPNEGEYQNPNETMIAVLSDGRVLLVNRNVSKPNRKLLTTSADGATSWTKPVFHPDLWEPICMASVLAIPSQPGTLLYSAPHTVAVDKSGKEVPAKKAKRQNLCIQMSRDDGVTWPVCKTLESGPGGYSDLALLSDGTVLCLYEGDKRITAARFGLDWVTRPAESKP